MPAKSRSGSTSKKSRSSSTSKKPSKKALKAKEKKEKKLLEEKKKNCHDKCEEATAILQPTKKQPVPNYAKARAAIDAALEFYDQDSEPYFLLAEIHRAQGEFTEAIQQYSKCLDLNPSLFQALESRAACYKATGEIALAIEDYTSIIEADPENDHAYNMRGLCILSTRVPGLRLKSTEFKKCVDDFKTATRLNEANYYAFANLGKTYEDQEMLPDAVNCYTSSLKVKDNYTYALFRRGCVQLRIVEDALRHAEPDKRQPSDSSAIKLPEITAPSNKVPQATIDDIRLEVLSDIKNKNEEKRLQGILDAAIADFEALLGNDPEVNTMLYDPAVVFNLSLCSIIKGELNKADDFLKLTEQIIESRPSLVEEGRAEPVPDPDRMKEVIKLRKAELKRLKIQRAQEQS